MTFVEPIRIGMLVMCRGEVTYAGRTSMEVRVEVTAENPFLGEGNGFGVPSKVDNQIWRVSGGLKGTLGDWAGSFSDIGYDFNVTYNQSISYFTQPDVIGFRLQNALSGFGGPNCTLTDTNPNQFGIQNTSVGTSAAARAAFGCYYWNPFASSFAEQPELGLANSRFIAGSENRADVARWLFDDRASETITSGLSVDLVFNGDSGIALPGGTIGWAAGTQMRQSEFRENVQSDLYNGNQQCDWPTDSTVAVGGVPTASTPRTITDPLFTGCTLDAGGPFVFFGTNPPDYCLLYTSQAAATTPRVAAHRTGLSTAFYPVTAGLAARCEAFFFSGLAQCCQLLMSVS